MNFNSFDGNFASLMTVDDMFVKKMSHAERLNHKFFDDLINLFKFLKYFEFPKYRNMDD